MNLLTKSVNKIYEQVIMLRNMKTDTKSKKELLQKLQLDYLKERGNNELLKSVVMGEEKIPVRCSILEKQALKELLGLRYTELFLNPELIEKIKKVTSNVPDEWSMSDIEIINKGDYDESIYSDRGKLIKDIIAAIKQRKLIKITNLKYQHKCVPMYLKYNEQTDEFGVVYATNPYDYEKKLKENFFYMDVEEHEMKSITIMDECVPEDYYKKMQDCLYKELYKYKVSFNVNEIGEVIKLLRRFAHYKREVEYKEDNTYMLTVEHGICVSGEHELITDMLSIKDKIISQGDWSSVPYFAVMNHSRQAYEKYKAMRDK